MNKEIIEDKQLEAIKNAWLAYADKENLELLKGIVEVDDDGNMIDITIEDAKNIFLAFDAQVVGEIIKWGLEDTEVQSSIWEFLRSAKISD